MLDGAARVEEMVLAAKADGQTRHRHHRSRQPVRRHRLLRDLSQARHDADHRSRGVHGGQLALRPTAASRQDRRHRWRHRGWPEALSPPDAARDRPTTGYRNLRELSSRAFLEGYYYKPRLDWELLERYTEGLIATSGCLGGVVLQALLARRLREGARTGGTSPDDLRSRRTSSSRCRTTASPSRCAPIPQLLQIARDLQAPLLATNDLHYVQPRRRRDARRAAVHRDRFAGGGPQPVPLPQRPALPQVRRRDALPLSRHPRGV